MTSLRALIVEDSEQDTALVVRELQKAGFSLTYRRVELASEMAEALERHDWDIVLSDYVLPGFGGLAALKLLRDKGLDLPFIVVSGQIGEDVAVEAMRAGAHDYIMKDNLKRLVPAVKRELAEAENRRRRRQAEEDVQRSARELRVLAQRLMQVQEEERRNIARELHDEIGQQLTMLKLLLSRTGKALGSSAPADLASAEKMVGELTQQVRTMSLRLRPGSLDELGLLPTLQSHLQDFAQKTGVQVDFKHAGLEAELAQDVSTCAYRVIQEALTNVVRHARASRVTVQAEVNDRTLAIQVADNGAGFNPGGVGSTSSGLRGMRERAQFLGGTFSLESTLSGGTRISVRLPLPGSS